MIKKLKYSQLAAGLSVKQAQINVWVSRGNLVADKDKMIDLDRPENKLWLQKQEENGRRLDLNIAFLKPSEANKVKQTRTLQRLPTLIGDKPEVLDDETLETRKLQKKIKQATLLRTQKAIQLDEIKIAKQLGQLVPFDAIKGFFLYVVETFVKSYDQESKVIADLILARFGADQSDFIEVKQDLSKKLVEIKEDTIDQLLTGLDQIVEEYQDVRGRGESK